MVMYGTGLNDGVNQALDVAKGGGGGSDEYD